MRPHTLAVLSTFSALCLAGPILSTRQTSSPYFIYPGDAPYGVDQPDLASILTCPNGVPTANAVLLVPGTGSTGEESFGQGYIPGLIANGYQPCYLTPPDRLMNDMQVTSAYIAYNIYLLASMTNLPIAIMGHSQANPDIQWALRFWPSTRQFVSMYIGLCPDLIGIGFDGLSDLCDIDASNGGYLCPASVWQQLAGSQYYTALDDTAGANFVEEVPTTLVWTYTDDLVIPPGPNAALPGAVNIPVQDICPGRQTDHATMLVDATGFALALDALQNGGYGSAERVLFSASGIESCFLVAAPGMDLGVVATVEALYNDLVDGFLDSTKIPAEPPVMSYALPANQ